MAKKINDNKEKQTNDRVFQEGGVID